MRTQPGNLNKSKVICFISCVKVVSDTRVQLFMGGTAYSNYSIKAIMPGINTSDNGVEHFPIPLTTTSFWYNARIMNTAQALAQRIRNSLYLLRLIVRMKPDICMAAEPDSWLIAVLMKWLYGCKVVVDLAEVYEDKSLAFPAIIQSFIRNRIRSLMVWLCQHTDQVIHVSPELQAVYSYLPLSGIVIHHYPKVNIFPVNNLCRS